LALEKLMIRGEISTKLIETNKSIWRFNK